MASSIDMFGTGGEGLGGLFTGIQAAQQQQALDAERQKTMADIANTQAITQQRQLGNEYEGAILGDKIQAYKDAATQKREDAQIEKYGKTGEQFGRMSQELRSMPAAARQARLQQIAQQQGIGADHPLLQQFMSTDPEQLPDLMEGFSKGFYEQSDKARAEKLKRDEMLKLEREKIQGRADVVKDQVEQRREAARQHNETLRAIAAMREGGANQRAAAKAGAAGGKAPPAPTTDKAIAGLIINDPNLTDEQKLEALQRYKFNLPAATKPDTSGITGLPSTQQRVEAAVRGSKPGGVQAPAPQTKASAAAGGDIAAAVKNTGQSYEPSKYEYQVTPDGRVLRRPKQAAVPK